MRVLGVVLAGGRATRMGGGDKCLLPLGGRPMLAHVLERLSPQVERVVLNANGDPARFAGFGLSVVADPIPGHPGPLAGVLAGMIHAAGAGCSHVATVAGDTPFFPADLVARLVAGAEAAAAPIALAASPDAAGRLWRHPTFGLWSVTLQDDLHTALEGGLRKVVAWTDRHGAATVAFPRQGDLDPFFNVNTPADMQAAAAFLAGG